MSYNNIVDLSSSEDRIYAAAQNALFFIDREELSINKITKNDGLSDVTIGAIQYDAALDLLIIGYANGNIDLLTDNSISNISTVKDAELIGGKRFHHVLVNNGLIYMANDQGIFVIDPQRKEIRESYRNLNAQGTLLGVTEMAFTSDSIYAATPSGILSASLSAQVNRQDFNSWQRNLTNVAFNNLTNTSSGLVASSANLFYRNDGANWALQNLTITEPIRDLVASGNQLFALTDSELNTISGNALTLVTTLDQSATSSKLVHNSQGHWIGKLGTGLLNFANGSFQTFSPSGPSSDDIWRLISDNDTIYNLSGGYSLFVEPLNRSGVISKFSQNRWSNTNVEINDINMPDLVDLEVLQNNRFDSDIFAASFQRGLINLSAEQIVIDENTVGSTLQRENGLLRITSTAREGNNLWITTHDFDNSIHRWDVENDTWDSFDFGITQAKFPLDILVLSNGDKWVSLDPNRGGGILVFNENTNLSRYLNTNGGQGGLPGREVTSMVVDQNFFLWVGTNAGIAFYPNPRAVLSGQSLSANIPIFENSFLLRNEFISAVAIDPGNRKWIGTATNGVWLFSETGEELVHHFTTENSPLLSNEIDDIAVDTKTGEVFIGTSSGLVSFSSDAIEGLSSHANVKAFPNPVTRDFNGVVTITGLVNSAALKITDASGKLVREIRAQGSSATWDTRDYNGQRVKTGVYLVFSSNSDGTETYVSKIAVI